MLSTEVPHDYHQSEDTESGWETKSEVIKDNGGGNSATAEPHQSDRSQPVHDSDLEGWGNGMEAGKGRLP